MLPELEKFFVKMAPAPPKGLGPALMRRYIQHLLVIQKKTGCSDSDLRQVLRAWNAKWGKEWKDEDLEAMLTTGER